MSMAEPLTALKTEWTQKLAPELVDLLASATVRRRNGCPPGRREPSGDALLRAGNQAMKAYFAKSRNRRSLARLSTLPTGEEVHRLEKLHQRPYVSIFGRFELPRVA